MKYANILTQELTDTLPTFLGATYNPGIDQLHAAGWREITEWATPTEGWSVTQWKAEDIDGATCRMTIGFQYDPVAAEVEREAQRQAARLESLTADHLQAAGVLRLKLRQYFGENAEVNRAVTTSSVTAYFMNRQGNPMLSTELKLTELADSMIIKTMFDKIIAWTGDGTIWSFPWEVLGA